MRRGFTLVELAIVLTILAIVTPAVFLLMRSIADDHARAVARLEDADAVRLVSESLRQDLRTGRLASAPAGLRVEGPGACFPVDYRVDGSVLVREAPAACGGAQALARRARSLSVEARVVTLVLGAEGEAPLAVAMAPGGAR